MLHLLGTIFFILLFALLFGAIVVLSIVRKVFKAGRKAAERAAGKDKTHASSSSYYSKTGEKTPQKKKVFDKDEGEYVDFEEIKD